MEIPPNKRFWISGGSALAAFSSSESYSAPSNSWTSGPDMGRWEFQRKIAIVRDENPIISNTG